jgi:uncharacterized protein YcfJ
MADDKNFTKSAVKAGGPVVAGAALGLLIGGPVGAAIGGGVGVIAKLITRKKKDVK